MPRLRTGPKGGKYYVNGFGSKVYVKNNRFGDKKTKILNKILDEIIPYLDEIDHFLQDYVKIFEYIIENIRNNKIEYKGEYIKLIDEIFQELKGMSGKINDRKLNKDLKELEKSIKGTSQRKSLYVPNEIPDDIYSINIVRYLDLDFNKLTDIQKNTVYTIYSRFPIPIKGEEDNIRKIFGKEIGNKYIKEVNELYKNFITVYLSNSSIPPNELFDSLKKKITNKEKMFSLNLKNPLENIKQKTIMFLCLAFGDDDIKKIAYENYDTYGYLKIKNHVGNSTSDDELLKNILERHTDIDIENFNTYYNTINDSVVKNKINITGKKQERRPPPSFLANIQKNSFGSYYHW